MRASRAIASRSPGSRLRRHAHEGAVEIVGVPRAAFDADALDRLQLVQALGRALGDHQHVVGARGEQTFHLPVADRVGAHHHASPTGELQHDGVAERHQVRTSSAFSPVGLGPRQLDAAVDAAFFRRVCSHHQRPARSGSPGCTGRVHGAQPIEVYP